MSASDPGTGWRSGLRPGVGLAVGIGCVAALLAGIVLWARSEQSAREAHPQLEGRIALPGLAEPVSVRRDPNGVPHVSAGNSLDAWAALGFVHAQDRLAQMLWLRRVARGRTAEWLGEDGLLPDRFARTVGFARIAAATLDELPEATRQVLDAYARGASARIARVREGAAGLPPALAAFGVEPIELEDWTAVDSVAVFKLLVWGAGPSLDAPAVLDALTQRLGGVGARPFEPQGENLQTITVAFTPPPISPNPNRRGRAADRVRPADGFVPHLYAGTAWALSGRHTASGQPVLAADWQLEPTAPALLHQAHVDSPGLGFAGALVPGVPVPWLGRSEQLAWAMLPARAVTTGFFEETVRQRVPEPLYHDGFSWKPLDLLEEPITVGRPQPGDLAEAAEAGQGGGEGDGRVDPWVVQRTRHGPLVHELFSNQGDVPSAPLALAWTGAVPGDGLSALIAAPRARSAAALRASLREHHDPVIAAVYADADGGGVQVAGWLPRRLLATSMQPVPGRLRTYDWTVRIPFDELPHQTLAGEDGSGGRDWVAVSDGPHRIGRRQDRRRCRVALAHRCARRAPRAPAGPLRCARARRPARRGGDPGRRRFR